MTLAELGGLANEQLVAHERECASCAGWLQQRQRLAASLDALRSSTARLQAPVAVEYAVMRAFRQSRTPSTPVMEVGPQPLAFRLSRLFGWGALAAVAAALAISLGLGIWFWQHSGDARGGSQEKASAGQQTPAQPDSEHASTVSASSSEKSKGREQARLERKAKASTIAVKQTAPVASADSSVAQVARAQVYVPLMLCDPLSCSGDEEVVRMELPASGVNGSRDSSQPLVADVVLGDDGLVRAIRIVQQ